MKKIFALMALLCAVLIAGVSCNDKKPDIKYQLDVEGLVQTSILRSPPSSRLSSATLTRSRLSPRATSLRSIRRLSKPVSNASFFKPSASRSSRELLTTSSSKVTSGRPTRESLFTLTKDSRTPPIPYTRPNPSLSGNFPPIHSATNTKGVRVSRFPFPSAGL